MSESKKDLEKKEGIKELVLARINIMPQNYKLSIGDKGTLTKDQMITHIKGESETGNQIIEMQMNFIKALTTGKLLETINKK
jgi:hypothetical protein